LRAGVRAGRIHLRRVAGNTVWSHMAGDVPWLCSLQLQSHSLQILPPFLANSVPCKLLSLQILFLVNSTSWINPFLANSHGCELWGLSLNIPLIAISTLCPCKLNSLQIQRPLNGDEHRPYGRIWQWCELYLHLFTWM